MNPRDLRPPDATSIAEDAADLRADEVIEVIGEIVGAPTPAELRIAAVETVIDLYRFRTTGGTVA